MFILAPIILLLIAATSALSSPTIITKVYITTHISILPTEPHCDAKCNIANNYLSGEMGTGLPWIWGKMTGNDLIGIMCTKDRCKECGFCRGKKVLEIGDKKLGF